MKRRSFQQIIKTTQKVIKEWEKVEQRPWGAEGSLIELSKQVGDLAKKVMVVEKYYFKKRETDPRYKTTKEEIGDELSDILFCLIRIAEHYKIDLEKEHLKALEEALKYLKN